MTKICKDCEPASKRPAVWPGPRCATHWRIEEKRRKTNRHGKHLEKTYQITAEEYQKLYESQGGKCAICRIATGKTKMLSVEHEHGLCDDHPPDQGCRRCIRCLACGRCNKLIAFLGPDALRRAIDVQVNPPARKVLSGMPIYDVECNNMGMWVEYDDGHNGGYPHWCTKAKINES